MNTFGSVLGLLETLPLVQEWPDIQMILSQAKAKQPRDWQLPGIACEAVGGSAERALPASAAVVCLQIGIILIDDMLDADPRGEYHRRGMPGTANLASAFQAIGLQAILQSEAGPEKVLAALASLNRMMLATALGQHLDVQNPSDEAAYWHLVRAKSSPFFGAAVNAGALLGGASSETAEQLRAFGHLYGEMIQIHDDLNDTLAVPAGPDWIQGRLPLPILFAQVVEHPDRQRFLELRRTIQDPEALSEAQTILLRCGAISYAVNQLLYRYQEARKILAATPLVHRAGLDDLLGTVVDPVRNLFAELGEALPDELIFHTGQASLDH